MALESFALLTADGDHAQADHLFAGKAGDLVAAITDFGQTMLKTTAARKLAGLLASPVCVY